MVHFLFQFLIALLWSLLYFLLECVAEGLMDLAFRGIARFFNTLEFRNPWVAAFVYVALGSLAGGLSLIFFPHPIGHPSKLHGISLFVSPVLAGVMMAGVGSLLRRRDKEVIQLESFRYGFALAFGMAAVRFLFAK
jgi:hypothetical protein